MAINVELFERVIAAIDNEPERLGMSHYFLRKEGEECGTACCIAGWACILSGAVPTNFEDIGDREEESYLVKTAQGERVFAVALGRESLGLSGDQANDLFHCSEWSRDDQIAYDNAENPRDRADITIKVIREFLAAQQEFNHEME